MPTSSSGRAPEPRAMRKNSHAPSALTTASRAARGAPPASTIQSARGAATTEKRMRSASSDIGAGAVARSDFHDLGLFGLDHLVDLPDVVVVDLLEVLLGVLHVVLAHARELLEAVAAVGAGMADRDLAVFRELVHHLHQLLGALLVHLRQRDADHAPLRRRLEAEVGLANRLLDRLH